jgi:vacuolar-type H+-ATPase subunit I/STV1
MPNEVRGEMKNRLLKVLKELKKERATIKEHNIWGGNNWEGMDIRIKRLEKLSKSKDIEVAILDLEDDLDEEISDIENRYSENEYDEMERERRPYEQLSEIIYEIKSGGL